MSGLKEVWEHIGRTGLRLGRGQTGKEADLILSENRRKEVGPEKGN